jgi:hypothetical protein
MQDQRVIYNSIDISPKVNDFRAGVQSFAYLAGGSLYIGSIAPFNNLWFEFGTLNVNSVTPTIQMWWANAWHDAVDVIDETSSATASGRITWSTDRFKSWDLEQSTEDVAGLSAQKIYWKYWLKITWSASFSVGTTLNYVGQKFSTDDILYSFYPDLSLADIKTGFEAGKTGWDEQHYMAAEHIIRDLKKRGIIKSRSQIMDWQLLQDAACHKVAEIVYQAFGSPYADQLAKARAAYNEALDLKYFNTDQNADGRLTPDERQISTVFGTR